MKDDQSLKADTYWNADWYKKYFDMVKKHKDRIVIELAGHDHWEDLRMISDIDGTEYRNLFIATGVTLIDG